MMRFDILTLFPDSFKAVMDISIIGRARDARIIEINTINIRDYSLDKHKKVDDYPYGGGSGMVMMAQPIFDAYSSIIDKLDYKPKVVYMSPQGRKLDQNLVKEFAVMKHIIVLCGHYEGIDERIIEEIVDEEVSAGDYVLTGGELPAMLLIDAVSRTIPGVLSSEEAYSEESHYNGLLEYPQYTRPYEFHGKKVPEILLSGHHSNISMWRRQQSIKRTYMKRPDLFEKLILDNEDARLFKENDKEKF